MYIHKYVCIIMYTLDELSLFTLYYVYIVLGIFYFKKRKSAVQHDGGI